MDSRATSWDLGTIYKRSWELTKNNRKLWILGLAVTVLASTGSSRSSNSSSSSRSTPQASPSPSSPSKESSRLLDLNQLTNTDEPNEARDAFEEFSYRFFSNTAFSLRKIPTATYIFAGIELFALILLFAIIGMAASAWSRGTMIYGCAQAEAAGNVDLTESAREGRRVVKTFLAIDYLPWLKVMTYGLIAFFAAIVTGILKLTVLVPIILIVYLIIAFVMAIRIVLSQIWAYRFAVITAKPYHAAMESGRYMYKGNIGKMLLLAFINNLIDFATSMVLLLPFGGAALISIIAAVLNPSPAAFVAAGITIFLSFLIGSPLIVAKSAIYQSFSYLTWHLSFKLFNKAPQNYETVS